MKKYILNIIAVTILLFAFSGLLFSQVVEGYVKDGPAGEPLYGITISIPDIGQTTPTDEYGFYHFEGVTTGTPITIEVGFTFQRTIIASTGTNRIDFWLNAVTDVDGNTYSAVEIGNQIWMGENLVTTRYNDNTAIPSVNLYDDLSVITYPAYCQPYYEPPYPFGNYYNWYAVRVGNGKLCPTGWHMPSNYDFNTLTTYLGGSDIAGGKLKEAGISHWYSPNTGATNESGFSAFAGGYLGPAGPSATYEYGNLQSIDEEGTNTGYVYSMYNNQTHAVLTDYLKYEMRNVRCVKDISQPGVSTVAISAVTKVSATVGGIVSFEGGSSVTARGVCWSTDNNPTVPSVNSTVDGTGTGTFTSDITSLSPGTTYYVRAYATNSVGTAYGEELSFTTEPVVGATLTFTAVSSITSTTAVSGGNITDDGGAPITARGVCWALTANPTISDSKTEDGKGTGIFTSNITGLSPGTLYHIRAYATNSSGTSYTNDYTFTTYAVPPTVYTVNIIDITQTAATAIGSVTDDGGASITARGVCWSTENNHPTTANDHTSEAAGIGLFDMQILNLDPNTLYYVRAYATNSVETAYGNVVSFTATESSPVAISIRATGVSSSGAVLNGIVYSSGLSTDVTFDYGEDTDYGNTVIPTSSPVSETNGIPVIAYISDLTQNTTYHYRIRAENTEGTTSLGEDMTFTTSSKVADNDGNIYNTVMIGSQLWFQENLKVTRYRNEDPLIYEATDWANPGNSTDGAYCNYGYDPANGEIYGHLYNYYATVDNRNLCPSGWHVATEDEWISLKEYLIANGFNYDGTLTENKVAKSLASTDLWGTSETEGNVGNDQASNNSTGFTGLPGGFIYPGQSFYPSGDAAVWWTATEENALIAVARHIWKEDAGLQRSGEGDDPKGRGFSVRCIEGEGLVLPWVTTVAPSGIATTTGVSGGSVDSDGGSPIISRGVCWGTSNNPTLENDHTTDGSGTGSFVSNISGMVPGTTYFLRAYATNSVGTAYGNEFSFITDILPPEAASHEATGVSSSGAVLNGTVNANGLSTEVTFEYGLTESYGNTVPSASSPVSEITSIPVIAHISGLSENTTYHYRIVVINSEGTVEGEDMTFTTSSKVADIDGNIYNTVMIGSQLWFQENLKTTHYLNGDEIIYSTDWPGLGNSTDGAYCNYGYDPDNGEIYGHLYNYYATVDNRNLCPSGWHVATEDEWISLKEYLIANGFNYDGTTTDNKIAKSLASTDLWGTSETEGAVGNNQAINNRSGFAGLPGGHIYPGGPFYPLGIGAVWWTATEENALIAVTRHIWSDGVGLQRSNVGDDAKNRGFYVRCLEGGGLVLPSVTTVAPSEVSATTCVSGGSVVSDGGSPIISRGICWSTSNNPTLENDQTTDESETGSFVSNISGLVPGKTYFLRAYATNSVGTAYGNEFSLTTDLLPHEAASREATGVSSSGAVLNGIVNASGLSTDVTFEYGLTESYENTVTSTSSPVSEINTIPVIAYISGLSENETYHFRIKAVSTAGTSIGEDMTFTTSSKVTDVDNNVYNTVKIGNQLWLQENLKVLHYRNGDEIPNKSDLEEWSSQTSGAYCDYDNDPSNVYLYGRLYNQYATVDSRSLCPTDWHVPSADEWIALENYLMANGYNYDGSLEGNKFAKSMASETGWDLDTSVEGAVGNPDHPAYKNKSGFTGLPAGYRYEQELGENGNFKAQGFGGVWWSTTDNLPTTAAAVSLWSGEAQEINSYGSENNDPKVRGFSVRCIHDPIVFNTNDEGEGSLRNAIEIANSSPGITNITFDIQGDGPFSIVPSSPLPNITETTIIDGYSQPGAEEATEETPATLKIELNGAAAGSGVNGIVIGTSNCEIKGLVINGFSHAGISIEGAGITGNKITGNYIGTNITGTLPHANSFGIGIYSSNNIIGGSVPGARNIISGNINQGIAISGGIHDEAHTSGNTIHGNYIGVDVSGSLKIPNNQGIVIINSSDNQIGGSATTDGNVISGNNSIGLYIGYTGSIQNRVEGNLIGTSANGLTVLGNGTEGININGPGNFIGGNDSGKRNIISGNNVGIALRDTADNCMVTGNYIGTDISGLISIPNNEDGIIIKGGKNNTVGGTSPGVQNIISGNGRYGVYITVSEKDDTAAFNFIQGNIIGLDASGTSMLGNVEDGIRIDTKNNIVGGVDEGAGNVISGNGGNGVHIWEKNASGNLIAGNLIGTDISGKIDLGNANAGVSLNTCVDNTLGGAEAGSRNIISGNNIGVAIQGPGNVPEPRLNKVLGNYIGTDITGMNAIGNFQGMFIGAAHENSIGGSAPGERNIISGNGTDEGHFGILLIDDASDNYIRGNFIGTDVLGTGALPNFIGIHILRGQNNFIGGTESGDGNLISGNFNDGILMYGEWLQEFDEYGEPVHNPDGSELRTLHPTENNIIQGNYIGPDISGLKPLGNSNGIRYGDYAFRNMIGGTEPGAGNVIAFNNITGVACGGGYVPSTGNSILLNSIHSNNAQGIDLGIDSNQAGVTPNDEGDTDTGANNLQNFPVFDSIQFDLANKEVFVSGSLESTPNSEFTLEFFASKVTDNTGYGEGQTYLGSATVTTDPSGFASFDETFTAYSSWGDVITATATDADGNTSEFSEAIGGTLSQILADVNQPFYYKVNETGHPNIFDGSDTAAISSAFKTWTDVETADIEFINAGTTPDKYASAIDGVNLVSFVDDQYPFPPGVLAMAAKTLKVEPGDNVAEIIDADIIFNPVYLNHPIYKIGVGEDVFDIQSIATHEIGHVLGLIHSGNPLATMFFMLDKGTEAQSLETDDKTWVSYRYPTPDYDLNFGTISGNITYGYNGDAVAGALVLATNTDPGTNESIHAYSDATGHYEVPVPPGTYNITIEPLDGDVEGYPLLPRNISVYVYANTVYTDYPKEYYNEGDTDGHLDNNEIPTDDESMVSSVTVSAGGVVSGKDLITNLDLIPPTVESVIPASDATGVDITQILKITFSEPVDENTLKDNTCYLTSDNGNIISTGSFKGEGGNSEIILFIPDESMSCQTLYTLHIAGGEAGVADLKGNELVEDYTSSFTTKSKDTDNPEVKSTIPENEAVDVYVISNVEIFFSEPMDKNTVEDGFVLSWLDEDSGSENNVEGSFEWDKNNSVMKFVPLSTFLEGEDYTISLPTSAKDLSGNSLAEALSSSFTTVGQAPPEIKYLGPDGTIPVTVTTPVVVDFSEPINPASVKYSTFKLLYGNQQVPGYYKFLNDNSRVVFVPDDDLLFNEVYTIIITDGIKDVSRPVQNKEDITTSVFTTADKVLTPHLEYIEPVSGVTGSLITVTGTGFDPSPENNVVIFNGIESNVIKSSLTSLVVKVPLGAISGPVSTKVNEVSSTNSKHFYVIPESLDPCDEGIANISTGSKSRDADIDPDGSMAYVTNPDAGTVSVIDMEEEEEVYEIQVGKEPMKIDIDPSGTRAYVTNFYSHTVSVIDLTSTPKQVIKTIPVGVNPYGVIVTPDGKRVYVANYTSENLSVIDVDPTSGGFDHVVSNINSGTQNRDEGMTGDGALLLVTGNDGLKIISSDPADLDYNTVIVNSSSGTRTHDVGVEGDAGIAFVTTEDGNILIIDINRGDDSFGAVLANQKSGSRGGDIEMSGDGLFIYVTDSDADQVLVYKIAYGGSEQNASYYTIPTLTLHNTIHVGDHPEGLVIDADNQQLLVVNSGAETAEASLQVIRICCGPIEPDVAIGELIITVQTIINYGIIDEPIGNDLINWLNAALDYWFKGDNKKAINRLNTFIRKVGDLVKGHRITKDQGQPLIDAATLIIDMLKAKGEITVNVETPVFDSGHPGTGPVTESTIGLIYPNPSTGSFTANYAVANDNEFNKVTIRVYDNNGKPVTTLVDRYMETGRYTVDWDGNFENGSPAPGGTYFVHFRAGDVETVRMIILIR